MAADVTFNVDVVMNLVDKTVQTTLRNMEASLSKMSKSAKDFKLDAAQNIGQDAEKLLSYGKSLNTIEQAFGRGSVQAKQYFKFITEGAGVSAKALKRVKFETSQINFQFLSLIFAGMAIQRTFGAVFRSIVEGYTKFTDANDVFVRKLDKLNASFLFLKFTIGQAFANSPLVQKLITILTNALTELAEFFDDNPELATNLALAAGAGFLFGGALFFIGEAASAALALKAFAPIATSLAKDIGLLVAKNPALFIFVTLLALAAAAILSFPTLKKEAIDIWEGFSDGVKQSVNDILSMLGVSVELENTWFALGAVGLVVFAAITEIVIELSTVFEAIIATLKLVGRAIRVSAMLPAMAVLGIWVAIAKIMNATGKYNIDTSAAEESLKAVGKAFIEETKQDFGKLSLTDAEKEAQQKRMDIISDPSGFISGLIKAKEQTQALSAITDTSAAANLALIDSFTQTSSSAEVTSESLSLLQTSIGNTDIASSQFAETLGTTVNTEVDNTTTKINEQKIALDGLATASEDAASRIENSFSRISNASRSFSFSRSSPITPFS